MDRVVSEASSALVIAARRAFGTRVANEHSEPGDSSARPRAPGAPRPAPAARVRGLSRAAIMLNAGLTEAKPGLAIPVLVKNLIGRPFRSSDAGWGA